MIRRSGRVVEGGTLLGVIPLNGVSRVRIPPPPPLSTPAAPACQHGASRLSARFGLGGTRFQQSASPVQAPLCSAWEPILAAVGFYARGMDSGRLADGWEPPTAGRRRADKRRRSRTVLKC